MQSETSLKERAPTNWSSVKGSRRACSNSTCIGAKKGSKPLFVPFKQNAVQKKKDSHGEGRDLQSNWSRNRFLVAKHSVKEGGNVTK